LNDKEIEIEIEYTPNKDMIVDPLTKAIDI